MSMVAVVGIGANELTIPLMMFPSSQEAEQFIGRFPGEWVKGPSQERFELGDSFHELLDENDDEAPHELHAALFKDGEYYDGCGGCYYLEVHAVEFGKPIVGWDLD